MTLIRCLCNIQSRNKRQQIRHERLILNPGPRAPVAKTNLLAGSAKQEASASARVHQRWHRLHHDVRAPVIEARPVCASPWRGY